jgi:flotillin
MSEALLIGADPGNVLLVYGVVAVVVVTLMVFSCASIARYYKRCPPNRILVIYGKTQHGAKAICLHGGAVLVMPLLQDHQWLALDPIRIELQEPSVLKRQPQSEPLPRVFSVAIGTDPELMQVAAVRLLGVDQAAIRQQAEDIIVTQLDRLIAALEAETVRYDSEEFFQRIEESINKKLNEIGLVLINFRRE